MTSNEIREKFLNFFKERSHAILPSASLIPTDQKGKTNLTLFNTAGVQPLIPYLLGQKHPQGKRLVSSQKCIRTIDIDEVGDKSHLTFFEMLGNWSLGDYFKEEAISWSFEFLTSKEEGLGLDPQRIYVTIFSGNEFSEKDNEALEIWKKFLPESRIYFLESNWWEAGENGPCGPDTEMFYDLTQKGLGEMTSAEFKIADDQENVVEIWNNVFMQFEKENNKIIGNLPFKAVDTGAGLERILTVVNQKESIFETDSFEKILGKIQAEASNYDEKSGRIVADHVKAATMIISDGILPSNTDRGYILRRLLRRAIRHADKMNLPNHFLISLVPEIKNLYQKVYENINLEEVIRVIEIEENKFRKTLKRGLSELEKLIKTEKNISGQEAFILFSTFGFPVELTEEIASEQGIKIELEDFSKEMKKHQELSRISTENKFKGGLETLGQMEIKYHTTTHLLHQALRDVLGDHVAQKGSSINADRLRFDFSHPEKLTEEEKIQIEEIINQKIQEALPVHQIILSKEEAEKTGALHFFDQKYGEEISLYYIGPDLSKAYSKEFCGGPHVKNTAELIHFQITKEEASSAGVRRIKGILKTE